MIIGGNSLVLILMYGAQFSATFDVNLYFLPQKNHSNLKFRPELTTLFSFLL